MFNRYGGKIYILILEDDIIMKRILVNTEIGVKYYLTIITLFLGLLSFILTGIAPKVWDDMIIFFFIPYIPLIISITISWDFLCENKLIHKIFGVLFMIINLLSIIWIWNKIGIPF